jgi:release factor glutamine methyltransferase
MTIRDALRAARERLAAAGVSSPDLDAALLLAETLGVKRERLALDPDRAMSDVEAGRFDALVARRVARVPMAQILGRAEFWSLDFKVTSDTLSPRPETELLVEAAVKALRGVASPVVVDVGTGTGCIAVAIAKEVPSATVHAVDVSPAALDVARENARRHGVADRVRFHEGDLFAPLVGVVAPGSVDVVVSNPPYVRRDEEFDPELLFEPATALFVDDVPGVYRRIAEEAAPFVRAGGVLLLELSDSAARSIEDAVRRVAAWRDVEVREDLAGLPRALSARRADDDAPPHRVALVVDRGFGDRLEPLASRVHVWIVDSPMNRPAAARLALPPDVAPSLETGFTMFRDSPDAPPDALVADWLDTIDQHHGRWSHDPPWTVLEVFGSAATAPLRSALARLRFTVVADTFDGFVAMRSTAASD